MSKIFGKSKSESKSSSTQTSSSGNYAYDDIRTNIGPAAYGNYNTASTAIGDELSGGWEGYKENRDFDFMRTLGLERTAGGQSGRGIFNSGATLKRLSEYDNSIHNQYYQDYMNNLFNQANLGTQGISQIGGAGGYSSSRGQSSGTSSSTSTPGIGGALGAGIGTFAASDRRLKENITKIGELENGLNVYSYTYVWSDEPTCGVMADEVAEVMPEALGPVAAGYQTLYYGKVLA
mgnify:CR=1 FL=1